MAHSCTVSHVLAWINAAQILGKWILSGKMQPLPTQWIYAEGPPRSVYTWLLWSCSCRLMKYHPPSAWTFWQLHRIRLDFSSTVFSTSWVWCIQPHCNSVVPPGVGNGDWRAGIGSGCPVSRSQAWSWPKESRCGLQRNLSCFVANVSVSKPVPEQILFESSPQTNFSYFFFQFLWFCCLFFSYCPWPQSHAIAIRFAFKAASVKAVGVWEVFKKKKATICHVIFLCTYGNKETSGDWELEHYTAFLWRLLVTVLCGRIVTNFSKMIN